MWPSLDNTGMVKLLMNPRILGQGGHVCNQPWTIPGWLSYLGTWEIPSHVSASLDMSGSASLGGGLPVRSRITFVCNMVSNGSMCSSMPRVMQERYIVPFIC